MLVLSRKKYQKLVISDGGRIVATLSVVEVRGDQVRIAVEAHPCIGVDREEVFEAKQAARPWPPSLHAAAEFGLKIHNASIAKDET